MVLISIAFDLLLSVKLVDDACCNGRAQGFTINEISADRAYSSRINLQTVANEGSKPTSPLGRTPRANLRGRFSGARCITTSC